MTNFDFFLSEPKFASFAEVAVSAEIILYVEPVHACSPRGRWIKRI